MVRRDERGVAKRRQQIRTRVRSIAIYLSPFDVALHRPGAPIGGDGASHVKTRLRLSLGGCHLAIPRGCASSAFRESVTGQPEGSTPCVTRTAVSQRSRPKATQPLHAGDPSAREIANALPKKSS